MRHPHDSRDLNAAPVLTKQELATERAAVEVSARPLTNLALFLIAAEWNVGH